MPKMTPEFEEAFMEFFSRYQKLIAEHYVESFPTLDPDVLGFDNNRKYVRVYAERSGGGSSVRCFVDKTNGNVLKASSWKTPAKHARSNIYDSDYGMSGVSVFGARYLR